MPDRLLVWVAGALLLAGCGKLPSAPSAAPPPSAPASEPEPTTIDEAEASLARGHERLKRLPPAGEQPKKEEPHAPKDPVARPTPMPAPESAHHDKAADASHDGGVCQDVCRTLASMRRAADTICRLAGPDDARCQGARRKVHDGEERASPCGCQPAQPR